MLTKDKMHELIDQLPEGFSTEDIIGRILLLNTIETSQAQIANGEGIDWEDLKKEMDSW